MTVADASPLTGASEATATTTAAAAVVDAGAVVAVSIALDDGLRESMDCSCSDGDVAAAREPAASAAVAGDGPRPPSSTLARRDSVNCARVSGMRCSARYKRCRCTALSMCSCRDVNSVGDMSTMVHAGTRVSGAEEATADESRASEERSDTESR
jgi:hypothetical protein